MVNNLATSILELTLVNPDPCRDAPFAYEWFSGEHGRDTLLKMGNVGSEITPPTLEGEKATIEEFIELEKQNKQLTWMLRYNDTTIGAAWIDVVENHAVKAPSIHMIIGDKGMRGKGIGKATMSRMIQYIKEVIETDYIYSRNLVSNVAIHALNQTIGMLEDGATYIDDNNLEWQNTKLSLKNGK